MNKVVRAITWISIGLVGIVACDTGQQTAGIDAGGIRPVAAEGPITAFGSIFVNGVRYEIGNAQINVNGVLTTEADLALGQIVGVAGQIQADGLNATADSVRFEANVRGPVDSIDEPASALVVLGQPVSFDASTALDFDGDPPVIGSLAVSDIVEVSGFSGADGTIVASRIERDASPELRVRGIAAGVNTGAMTFSINGLALDYSAAITIEGFPTGEPMDGDEVIAIGQSLGGAGELLVEQLRLHERLGGGSAGEEAEVEGLITRFVSPTDFDVAGLPITTTPTTVYEDGDQSNLLLNVKIQVEGTLNAAGVIVADKIEIKDGGQVFGG